jgi:hypothetical protein
VSSTPAKRCGVYLGKLVSSNRGSAGKHCIGENQVWQFFRSQHPVICWVPKRHCWVKTRAYPMLRSDSNGLLRLLRQKHPPSSQCAEVNGCFCLCLQMFGQVRSIHTSAHDLQHQYAKKVVIKSDVCGCLGCGHKRVDDKRFC